ncbi:hypothetical protein KBC04_02035 [Candidatus Babeliales bacterium]|nr:hypothetical protein [Candidatus Babeliales bacterium]MBP9843811.1 hypothetical protein [Candidatus Babeliales bacterium]
MKQSKIITFIALLSLVNSHIETFDAEYIAPLQEQSFLDQFQTLAAGGIAQITVAQIPTISTSVIPFITNDQITQFIVAQIKVFTINQIAAFTPGQISAFTVPNSQNSAIINQIGAFTDNQIQTLKNNQVQGLTADQLLIIFDRLSLDQIKALTVNQIQTLPIDQLTSMTEAQLGAFSPEQIEFFTPNQLALIMTVKTKTILENLSPIQTSGISAAQINGMLPNQRTLLFNMLSIQTNSQNPNRANQLEILSGIDTITKTIKKPSENEPQYAGSTLDKQTGFYEVNKQTGLAVSNDTATKNLNKGFSKKTWKLKK